MKNLIPVALLFCIALSMGACQEKCGTCYITIDGVEEPDTRKPEMCDDAYETLKESGEPERKTWEQVYPGSTVEYVCEDN